MSKWFTCTECNKQFEYDNEAIVQDIEKALDGDPFVCEKCGDTITAEPDAVLTVPPGMKVKVPSQRESRGRGIGRAIA